MSTLGTHSSLHVWILFQRKSYTIILTHLVCLRLFSKLHETNSYRVTSFHKISVCFPKSSGATFLVPLLHCGNDCNKRWKAWGGLATQTSGPNGKWVQAQRCPMRALPSRRTTSFWYKSPEALQPPTYTLSCPSKELCSLREIVEDDIRRKKKIRIWNSVVTCELRKYFLIL